jgi:hypothetical protein
MTRLVHAELLKLWTTRTARIVLVLAAAGPAALTVAVLTLAGRGSRRWATTPRASSSASPTGP